MKQIVILSLAVFSLVGCYEETNTGSTTAKEMEQTEENHKKLVTAVPPPQLSTSQERINLKKRLERFNNESKVSYIYLVNYGKVMAFYTVKGKVSSVNSLLTTPDQIVARSRNASGAGYDHLVIASPDLDGSYGSNGDAIFFFTTEDVYVEWRGDYMLCDQPLKLSTPPEMVIQVEEKD